MNHMDVMNCPSCGGTGESFWMVWDVIDRQEQSVTEADYLRAAEDEDDAFLKGQRYCKLDCGCDTCKGVGSVFVDRFGDVHPME